MNTYSTCSYGIIFSGMIRIFRSSKVNVDSGNESYGRDTKPDWNVSEIIVTAESQRALKAQTCGKVSRTVALFFFAPQLLTAVGGVHQELSPSDLWFSLMLAKLSAALKVNSKSEF